MFPFESSMDLGSPVVPLVYAINAGLLLPKFCESTIDDLFPNLHTSSKFIDICSELPFSGVKYKVILRLSE